MVSVAAQRRITVNVWSFYRILSYRQITIIWIKMEPHVMVNLICSRVYDAYEVCKKILKSGKAFTNHREWLGT